MQRFFSILGDSLSTLHHVLIEMVALGITGVLYETDNKGSPKDKVFPILAFNLERPDPIVPIC